MSLNIATYSNTMQIDIGAKSYNGHFYNGIMLPTFTTAIATGVINTSLTLVGRIVSPNFGTTTGTGIFFNGTNIANTIRSTAISLFGQEGPALKDICDAIGASTQTHFELASLSSTLSGTATFVSFSGAIVAMTIAIINAAPEFTGTQWPNFAQAIATGICTEIGTNGTGTLSGTTIPVVPIRLANVTIL